RAGTGYWPGGETGSRGTTRLPRPRRGGPATARRPRARPHGFGRPARLLLLPAPALVRRHPRAARGPAGEGAAAAQAAGVSAEPGRTRARRALRRRARAHRPDARARRPRAALVPRRLRSVLLAARADHRPAPRARPGSAPPDAGVARQAADARRPARDGVVHREARRGPLAPQPGAGR